MEEYPYDSDLETLLREGLLANMHESYLNNVMPSTPLDPELGPIYAGSDFPSEESLAESNLSQSYAPPAPPPESMDDFSVQQLMQPPMPDFMYQPPPTQFINVPQPTDFLTAPAPPSNNMMSAAAAAASSDMLSAPHHHQFSQPPPPLSSSPPAFVYKSEYAYPSNTSVAAAAAAAAQPILYPDLASQNQPTANDQCYVRKACVGCKQSHVACDSARPCARCKRLNKSEQCVDAERKKRGRPSGSGKKKDN